MTSRASDNGHYWTDADKLIRWSHCVRCLIVRRADGKNNPCRGSVKVTLRRLPLRPVGRPPSPEGRVRLSATVPPYVKQWLSAQTDGASGAIRRLVDTQLCNINACRSSRTAVHGDICHGEFRATRSWFSDQRCTLCGFVRL